MVTQRTVPRIMPKVTTLDSKPTAAVAMAVMRSVRALYCMAVTAYSQHLPVIAAALMALDGRGAVDGRQYDRRSVSDVGRKGQRQAPQPAAKAGSCG